MKDRPALKPLHEAETFSSAKLAMFEKHDSSSLKDSPAPGQERCLKARPDGTILDGHHRVYVLRSRGEDVDSLPREILVSGSEVPNSQA